MKTIVKFEIKKITQNWSFLGGAIVTIVAILGIFFACLHYSQLSLVENNNARKGASDLYWTISKQSAGNFDDPKVEEILTDFVKRYQEEPVATRPFDLYSSNIADAFFPSDEDIYLKIEDAMKNKSKVSMDQIHLKTLKEVGFPSFKEPLKIGNYIPWADLFKVAGYVFLLSTIIGIIISSLVFANDTQKNINQLLLTTKYGRNKLTVSKIVAAILLSSSIFLILEAVTFGIFLIYNYGVSGWDAAIQTNFSFHLFSFPVRMDNVMVWAVLLVFYLAGLLSVIAVTLLISALMKSSFAVLIISMGLFLLPKVVTYLIKEGFANSLLYLFPINNFSVESMLTFLSNQQIMAGSFYSNYGLILLIYIGLTFVLSVAIYQKINHQKKV